jgi:hypothetical protein
MSILDITTEYYHRIQMGFPKHHDQVSDPVGGLEHGPTRVLERDTLDTLDSLLPRSHRPARILFCMPYNNPCPVFFPGAPLISRSDRPSRLAHVFCLGVPRWSML